MDSEQLRNELTKLHQELSTVDSVDDSTKQMLTTVMQDIVKVLSGEHTGEGDTPQASSEHLRSMMSEFEAEHPKLAQTLGQLADGLANLGI
ncbi:DUF4404 family protein [Aeoliella sp. ICT_H6.2]|uniref:DUF4404 family protein n=1 Tax=Aeoliella straminimaris TaxID=2954799 RepID=A0A9X2FB77_9BACT|nr:DUF4404 family protein [Aeoliella straminimaris]MCO6044978.1 DUF4404 family protein [Aeoliella straminimaris]